MGPHDSRTGGFCFVLRPACASEVLGTARPGLRGGYSTASVVPCGGSKGGRPGAGGGRPFGSKPPPALCSGTTRPVLWAVWEAPDARGGELNGLGHDRACALCAAPFFCYAPTRGGPVGEGPQLAFAGSRWFFNFSATPTNAGLIKCSIVPPQLRLTGHASHVFIHVLWSCASALLLGH